MSLLPDERGNDGLAPAWVRQVELKENSADPHIRSSLFLGTDLRHHVPIFLPRHVLDAGHFVVRGTTGTGKTSATLLPLALQVLRPYRDASGRDAPPSPLVIIDLKGDDAFFHAVWEAASRAGRKFRYFSVAHDHDYHFFDPLQIFLLGILEPVQLATTFLRAFSLDYGLIYGGLYFTHQNLAALYDAVLQLQRWPKEQVTIATLSNAVIRVAGANRMADAQHIQSCLKLLAAYPQVDRRPDEPLPSERIDMPRVLENSEVVYFHLRLQDQAASLRQIAAFAMYALIQAAQVRRQRGLPQRDTFVIIDEFYHIAGKSFGDMLATVREWGLRFILSHQTPDQLKHHDAALPDVIQGNTAVEQAYALTQDDERYFQLASGEIQRMEQSVGYDANRGYHYTIHPVRDYRLTDEAMKQTSDTPLRSALLTKFDDRSGLRPDRVQLVQAVYPLTTDHYQRLRFTPLPQRLAIALPPSPNDAPPPKARPASPTAHPQEAPHGGQHPNRSPLHERMRKKWSDLAALEQC